MGAKVATLGAKNTAAVFAAAVFGTNWLSAKYLAFPFAWCWGRPLIGPIFEPWLFLIHIIALAYFCICLVSQNVARIFGALVVVILAYGIPGFMETLFRLGKNCN